MQTERQLITTYAGSAGRSELWEVVGSDAAHPGLERVIYEVIFGGKTHVCLTVGEASILASELSGDERFEEERMTIQTGYSNL
jgi:hypothetical protein